MKKFVLPKANASAGDRLSNVDGQLRWLSKEEWLKSLGPGELAVLLDDVWKYGIDYLEDAGILSHKEGFE